MSKIVSYTLNSINGPAYFRIWTADGKILSYGNSDDSRALKSTSNHINIWLLKSIEDRYGNKITYHYQNDPHSYRLSHISYSGNDIDDLDPAFSVTFQYDNRDDVEIVYHGDRMQKKNVLLSSITVYNKSYQMALYRFNYKKPDLQSGYPYHLLESIQCDVGNQHLNPTKIQWGDNNYNIPMINTTNVQVTTNSIDNAFAGAIKFPGDFNGDGFTDVIAVRPLPNGSYRHQADLFLNRGLSNGLKFNFVRSFELSENMHWIYVADFNGDGRDDILLTDRMRAAEPIPDFITSSLYLSTMHPNGIPTFTKHELNSYPIRNNLQESLIIGDFFGEGQQSILIQSLKPNKGGERSILIHYKHSDNSFQCYEFDEHLEANRFYQLCDKALNNPLLSTAAALQRLGLLFEFIGLAIESHEKTVRQINRREPRSPHHKSDYVRYAVDYMENNYATSMSVAEVSDYLGIDRSYFSVIFKQIQGLSPNEFLLRIRMRKSIHFLQNPSMPIREIAHQVGYEDALTFSKAFKRFFGVSPKHYRDLPAERRPKMPEPEKE